MWVIALCHDVAFEQAKRSALFQAHVGHNLRRIGSFLLTAPLATADGVSGREDDPRLCGSVYCLDVESLPLARDIMESDPYMHAAWRQIDYYQWSSPSGVWLDPKTSYRRPGPDFRFYIANSHTTLKMDGALIRGQVTFLGSTGAVPEPLAEIAVLQAENIEDATERASGASWVVALPIAIGRWVGVSSVADLQA